MSFFWGLRVDEPLDREVKLVDESEGVHVRTDQRSCDRCEEDQVTRRTLRPRWTVKEESNPELKSGYVCPAQGSNSALQGARTTKLGGLDNALS